MKKDEVVCPRCQLHFVPERTAGRLSEAPRQTVLLVEDDSYLREVAEEALSSRYEVKTASTRLEAEAALAGGGIDLMVLDLTLDGGHNGLELLRTLKRKPCPILICTALDESEMYGESWEALQKLGADDLVRKGMNVGETLVPKVGALLGRDWDEED
jgi:DNA-binding response OmpR family regulator